LEGGFAFVRVRGRTRAHEFLCSLYLGVVAGDNHSCCMLGWVDGDRHDGGRCAAGSTVERMRIKSADDYNIVCASQSYDRHDSKQIH
jgi:hypothetical protein